MTTEIRFYHLQSQGIENALPQLLSKAHERGHKIVIRAGNEGEVEQINTHLWIFRADVFLPHGSAKDGHAAQQPIWITAQDENPNNADVLFIVNDVDVKNLDDYALVCRIFDGSDDRALTAARAVWKQYKDDGHKLTYWQQDDAGKWTQKA